MKKNRRRSNLPKSRLQLKLVLTFLAMGLVSLVAMLIFSQSAVRELGEGIPGMSEHVSAINQTLMHQFLIAACLLIPLMLSAGVLLTFRVAGPALRVENYLWAISRGESPPPCTLRRGDELIELCDAANAAVERLREAQPSESIEPVSVE